MLHLSSMNYSEGQTSGNAETADYRCLGCGCPSEVNQVLAGNPFHSKDCWLAFNREYGKDVCRFFESLICRVFLQENVSRSTQELRALAIHDIKEIRHLTASRFPKPAMLAAAHSQLINGFVSATPRKGGSLYAGVKYPYLFNPYVPHENEREEMLRERAWRNQWIFKVYDELIEHFSMGSERCEYFFILNDEINVPTDTLWQRLCDDPVYPDKVFFSPFDCGYF